MKKTLNFLLNCIITYITLISLMYTSSIIGNQMFSNSLFSVFIYIIIFILYIKYLLISNYKDNTKYFFASNLLCLITAFIIVVGYNLTINNTSDLDNIFTYVCICGHYTLIVAIVNCIRTNLNKVKNFFEKIDLSIFEKYIFNRKCFLKCLILILLAWFPVFLAFYPGIFSYDAPYQFSDYYFKVFDTGNPIIHTLLIGFTLNIGHNFFDNYNIGLLIYSIVQSLILASTMSYIISYMNNEKINRYLKVIMLLIFMFLPTHSILAITTTKDVIFSCCVTILFVKIIELVKKPTIFFEKNNFLNIITFIIFSFLTFVFRPNGIYAYTFMLPFVIIVLNNYRKKFIMMSAIIYLLFFGYNFAINKNFNTGEVHKGYSPIYCVPFQQVGRTYIYGGLSLKEKKYINSLLSYDDIEPLSFYAPHISDPIFRNMNGEFAYNNKSLFINEYFKLFKKYPIIYLDAFLDNTIGYWYFSDVLPDTTYYRPYLEMYTEDRDYHTNNQIKNESKFSWLYAKYKTIVENGKYQKIPILSILMCNAVYNLLLIFSLIILVIYRKYKEIVPLLFLLGLIGTNFLGPVSLTRYCYYLYLCAPFIIIIVYSALAKNKK